MDSTEESLLPSEKKKKQGMPLCAKATIAILSLLLAAAIIGIFIAALLPKVPLYFSHYTAECTTILVDGDNTTKQRIRQTKEVVFSVTKWYQQSLSNGEVLHSLYTDGDSTIECSTIGTHKNCYAIDGNEYDSFFFVPGHASLVKEETDCPVFPVQTSRNFSKCTVLTFTVGTDMKTVYIESDTQYPVMVQTLTTSSEIGVYISQQYYVSFSDEKPTDESGFKPFDNTTVYDFRCGKGDAGDGKSNVYEQLTFSASKGSLMKSVLSKFSWKNVLYYLNPEKYFMNNVKNSIYKMFSSMEFPSQNVVNTPVNSIRDVSDIPASFDAREYWSNCSSIIDKIMDQGRCGSCWAMASAGVAADRVCIATGKKQPLSAQFLIYCSVAACGCQGPPNNAILWESINIIGIPSEECVPYIAREGKCPTRCQDGSKITNTSRVYPTGYVVPWAKTDADNVVAIQREIMTNGPVTATFMVFSDFNPFIHESFGIYHRSANATYSWLFTVRIIGWGSESGVDYWLAAYSKGTTYEGKELPGKGYFRIRRGNNECNIEQQVVAGLFA